MLLPFFIVFIAIIVSVVIRTKYRVLCNEMFWLISSWGLIIGVYLFSGIEWDYPVSLGTWVFICVCFIMFVVFRFVGKHSSNFVFISPGSKIHVSLKFYLLLGVFGTFLYIFDYIRLNGLRTEKGDYEISIIGTIGNLCVPILLLCGLYLFAKAYVTSGKLSIKGIFCLVIYIIPCVINGGRENVLYLVISASAVVGYAKWKESQKTIASPKKSFIGKVMIFAVGCLLIGIIVIVSNNRFSGDVANFYFNAMHVPDAVRREASLFGPASNLYANVVYYAVHELPGLEMVLRFYDGPYMYGMYELNIISRRLPSSLGLDYTLVFDQVTNIMRKTSDATVLIHGWKTMLASLVFDFGKWLSPVICGILGYCTGVIRKKFEEQNSIENIVLVSVLCLSMFTTIQLGPFFNFSVYGAYIWWFIIFRSRVAIYKK